MCQPQTGMRVVITGKGGVGKTTLTSCLATVLASAGTHVLAVDEDPQMNLPNALGVAYDDAANIVPLNRHADYIEEKTGIRPGRNGWGALFKLNPDVGDVVSRLGLKVAENLSLLVMGTVKQAGGGCLCAENVLLDATIRHLALRMNEAILLDTQAGMEHFGRSLAKGFGQCVVVADSSFNALSVALQSASLARETGIGLVHLAVNRVTTGDIRLERFERESGQKLRDVFDTVVQLPAEPLLQALDPHVARIMTDRQNGYATAVLQLASLLCSPPCPCASGHQQPHHHHHAH